MSERHDESHINSAVHPHDEDELTAAELTDTLSRGHEEEDDPMDLAKMSQAPTRKRRKAAFFSRSCL